MNRAINLALCLAAALSLGAVSLGAAPVLAQSAAAKAAVDTAKTNGVVGEQGDGYLGIVRGGDDNVRAAVAEINAGRAAVYRETAARTGVTPEAAGQATAQQLLARLPAGQYYKPLNGAWTLK